jgi:hypothetical protein
MTPNRAATNTSVFFALLIAVAANAQPDPTLSFFVPQAGPLTTPCEGGTGNCLSVGSYGPTIGGGAIANFRRCPNSDGPQILRNWARLMIVVRDSDGFPIVGIAAADICLLFNGGTPAQGFSGAGDDSIIANSMWNSVAGCPDVRCVEADAPTDANGVTYITLLGHNPVDPPGTASRDPLRKWGGYAGDVPVRVLGVQLQGRLTSTSPFGSYTAHVKNYDSEGGRLAIQNQGERVEIGDFNVFSAAYTGPYRYHLDFDNNGVMTILDRNLFQAHYGHRCNVPPE